VKKVIRNICMLSTHGYFDPVPQLGRTDTGGQVVYVIELAKALARKGYKTDIYTRWFEPDKNQIDPVPGFPDVRVIRIKAGPWEFIPKETIYGFLPELAENMRLFIKGKGLDYDLFHAHYVDAGMVMMDVARVFQEPAFFTAHSLGAWKREEMGGNPIEMEQKFNFTKRIKEEDRIYAGATGHIVTSKLQHEKLKAFYHYHKKNVAVIPPGVDIEKYHFPTESDTTVRTGIPEKYIYYLSRIDNTKGHDVLLYAFDLVREEINDINLVIGGGSPSPKARELEVFGMMKKIIDERGMSDRVKIIGYVPDNMMTPYYQNAQIFVLPSLFEPFGMTTSEAMACGKAVVASKYGGIRNVIKDGVNGLLVDPKNEREFADAMIRLLKDDALRNRVGLAASELITKKYCWDAIAEKHIAFYMRFV
jgi:mannosylfructose-phosphate synthase